MYKLYIYRIYIKTGLPLVYAKNVIIVNGNDNNILHVLFISQFYHVHISYKSP